MTPTLKWSRDNMRPETGPERAARRAARNGLTVGAPVRAEVMTKTPPGPQHELVPLEFGERMTNYRLQVAVRDHCLTGARWRPTARQRRRLEHKARSASYRKLLASQSLRGPYGTAADTPAWPTAEQRAEPLRELVASGAVIHPASPAAPRGFRVVDRRGEHRS